MKISKYHQFVSFLKTPLLWQDNLNSIEQLHIPIQEIDTEELEDYINFPDKEVLGKRIERLFEYYLQQHPDYDVLAKNIQILDDKITIGELDFIFFDRNNENSIHLELVFKFYLYDPSIAEELERWIGPNRKDRLVDKLSKLKEKQLPLLFKEETQSALKKLYITPKKWTQKVCFKANLFIPVSYKNKVFPIINNTCICGYWIPVREFQQKDYQNYLFHIPEKKYWMVDPKYNEEWDNFENVYPEIDRLIQIKRSPLLWLKDKEDQYFRLFIVWW